MTLAFVRDAIPTIHLELPGPHWVNPGRLGFVSGGFVYRENKTRFKQSNVSFCGAGGGNTPQIADRIVVGRLFII